MSFLQLKNINKQIGDRFVLNKISFSQEKGQRIAISGETGSGKTTLLKLIAGLMQSDSGEAMLNGERILGPQDKLMPGHKGIAYLSQYFELPNHYHVEELVSFENKLSPGEADKIYQVCDIQHLVKRKTQQLSGGERQRISIARALISAPLLLLLDEPFSNIDMIHKASLKNIIRDIEQHLGVTIILVSHDPQDTLSWASHIIVLKEGMIIQQNNAHDIYYHPADSYVAGLFGKFNIPDPGVFRDSISYSSHGHFSILRPDELEISKHGQGAEGKVTGILFLGGLYEIEITIHNRKYFISSTILNVEIGEIVKISVNKKNK